VARYPGRGYKKNPWLFKHAAMRGMQKAEMYFLRSKILLAMWATIFEMYDVACTRNETVSSGHGAITGDGILPARAL
jgi:hypothetical protein